MGARNAGPLVVDWLGFCCSDKFSAFASSVVSRRYLLPVKAQARGSLCVVQPFGLILNDCPDGVGGLFTTMTTSETNAAIFTSHPGRG